MKNFGTLYYFELKKLFQRKAAWAVVLLLAVMMAFFAWPPRYTGGYTATLTDREGNTVSRYVWANEQRELVRAGERRISGQVMDEAFFRRLREASTGDGVYLIREQLDSDSYFYLIDSSYSQPYFMVAYNMGLDPAATTAEDFYGHRRELIQRQWETDAETAYWEAMEARVEKPFTYRYSQGYQDILSYVFGLSSMIPLAAAVCLCGVFSEEKRTRADALIFSSRHGRSPLCLAKVLAGLTAGLAAGLLPVGAIAAVILLTRGWDGFDAALQLGHLTSSLPLSMGQAALVMCGLLLLYGLLCGGAAMLLSALTRSSIAALAGPVLFMVGQSWLRLDVQAAEYLPNQLFNVIPSLRSTHLVELFGHCFNRLQFCSLLYGALTLLLTALCWPFWRRSAVSSP